MKTRFKAEIIEIYDSGSVAAIKFRCNGKDRVECVKRPYSNLDFELGMTGIISFLTDYRQGYWHFEGKAAKNENRAKI